MGLYEKKLGRRTLLEERKKCVECASFVPINTESKLFEVLATQHVTYGTTKYDD
jgi:hypothetical protein